MADAMARLWAKFLPEIERRVASLEAALQALRAGSLTAELQATAHADAHKLAGSLGTFGLQQGTELARQAELMLAGSISTGDSAALESIVRDLRVLVASRG
jgi:HPt (histidine-containing phosphotransfer) domain-containing protein